MEPKISSDEMKKLAKKLTVKGICQETGYSRKTVWKRLKKLGVKAQIVVRTSKKGDKAEQIQQNLVETAQDAVKKALEKRQFVDNSRKIKMLTEELIKVTTERDAFLQVGPVSTYTIKAEPGSSDSQATVVVLLSDWHIEEPVKSSQVNGLNEFNIKIAQERADKLFRLIAKLIKIHQKEYRIDNLILALLGDFISGSIHDDLKEANSIQPTEAIWEAQKIIASGIEYLLQESDVDLIIPCCSGNHGRMTDKQRVATEYGNSLEILMYRQLEKYFSDEKRIKFIINDSYLTYLRVYDYSLRFHHGHAIRYGGGVGGLFIPAFKAISQWNKSKHADWDFFGHFHQLKDGGNFICNGSLIGFNAFAVKIKADFEDPKQAFIIIEDNRGMDLTRKINLV